MLFTLVFVIVVCIVSAFKSGIGCGRFPGLFRNPRYHLQRPAMTTPKKQSVNLHELTASPVRDLAADDPRSKFLRAYNILFGACVVRGVYPVINTMLGSMNCANPEFQGRNLNGTVESLVNVTTIVESLSQSAPGACEEQALARLKPEHRALLKNHLEVLGGGLMVAARDTVVRLRMEDQVNFIEEKWSDEDFNILLQDLVKTRQETGAAATCDEIYIYDQLMVCLRRLDRRYDYFDDNLYT